MNPPSPVATSNTLPAEIVLNLSAILVASDVANLFGKSSIFHFSRSMECLEIRKMELVGYISTVGRWRDYRSTSMHAY